MDFFAGLRAARAGLLALSAAGYRATRVRILPEGVVVEITEPLAGAEPVTERGGYHHARLGDCDVVWRQPEEGA